MPTYYTAQIDDYPNLTTKMWMAKYLARAMGYLAEYRDEMELPPEQLLKLIENYTPSEYYTNSLKEGTEELLKVLKFTDAQWNQEWEKYKAILEKENAKSIVEAEKTQKRHFAVIADLQKIIDSKATGWVTKNTAKFGISQLELVKSQRQPFVQTPQSLEEYIKSKIAHLKKSIAYDKKSLKEDKERHRERVFFYSQLLKDLDKVFPEEVKTSET